MYLVINKCVTAVKIPNFSGHYLPKSGTFLLGHPVYTIYIFICIYIHKQLTEYIAGGKIEKNEMGGACGACVSEERGVQVSGGET